MPDPLKSILLPDVQQRIAAQAEKQMLLNQLRWQWAGGCMAYMVNINDTQESLDNKAAQAFRAADALLAQMGHKAVNLKKKEDG